MNNNNKSNKELKEENKILKYMLGCFISFYFIMGWLMVKILVPALEGKSIEFIRASISPLTFITCLLMSIIFFYFGICVLYLMIKDTAKKLRLKKINKNII